MNSKDYIAIDQEYVMRTYGRYPLVIDSGKNAQFTDCEGNTYIDFSSGIGVNALGVSDGKWLEAVIAQLYKIQHHSNYFYSPAATMLAEKLVTMAGMNRVFFCNSGAEAAEGAVKLARKYSHDKYNPLRKTIISLRQSFHGRTVTTLAATGQEQFHNFFEPFTQGFKYVAANDFEEMKANMTDDVCAVLIEPIQGEGGVNMIEAGYVKAVGELCRQHDALLIFDEVQTGIGRTGKFLAYEYFDVKPDIITVAKGLGGGLPIGAILCGEKCADTFEPGQHGSTFGSNPVAAAGAAAVLSRLTPEFLEDVRNKGGYLMDRLTAIPSEHIKEIRGKGLMIGMQIDCDTRAAAQAALERGLIILTAGKDVLRMLPPLTITYEDIDKGAEILRDVLTNC